MYFEFGIMKNFFYTVSKWFCVFMSCVHVTLVCMWIVLVSRVATAQILLALLFAGAAVVIHIKQKKLRQAIDES